MSNLHFTFNLEYNPSYVILWACMTETHKMAPISLLDLFVVHLFEWRFILHQFFFMTVLPRMERSRKPRAACSNIRTNTISMDYTSSFSMNLCKQ